MSRTLKPCDTESFTGILEIITAAGQMLGSRIEMLFQLLGSLFGRLGAVFANIPPEVLAPLTPILGQLPGGAGLAGLAEISCGITFGFGQGCTTLLPEGKFFRPATGGQVSAAAAERAASRRA